MIDPLCFRWTDQAWQGIASVEGQVLYELHVGTFTPQGTWTAALQQLPYLADLGITVLEIMPMAEFPGSFGWGYDGVDLFAPFHGYGIPDDVRRFVDRAHALGLGVILDVVYNHLGPEGNVLGHYSDDYFSRKYQSEWGDTFNFDGPGSGPVREFVLANVAYWVEEFHFDGMRVDAIQGLYDSSPVHILAQIARRMREAAGDRRILIVGESEPQRAGLLRGADRGGIGFDMLWSDDFHHTTTVAATGNREAYYGDYLGSPQELVSVLKRGWLYQGQWDLRQGKRRGSPALDIAPSAFIGYLQNHDQIANTARGERLHARTTPGRFRALCASFCSARRRRCCFKDRSLLRRACFSTSATPDRRLPSSFARAAGNSSSSSQAWRRTRCRLKCRARAITICSIARSSTLPSVTSARTPRRWCCTATSCCFDSEIRLSVPASAGRY